MKFVVIQRETVRRVHFVEAEGADIYEAAQNIKPDAARTIVETGAERTHCSGGIEADQANDGWRAWVLRLFK